MSKKKKLPKPLWVRRNYDFAGLEVGDALWAYESFGYFRSSASKWFRKNGRTYTTFMEDVDGGAGRGLRLVRMS